MKLASRQLNIPPPDVVPATIQERAWSSPIWYSPSEEEKAKAPKGTLVASITQEGAEALTDDQSKALIVGKSIAMLPGLLHGSALATTQSSEMVTAGAAIAILITVSLLAGQAASIRVQWARVALRVVGSWIAAIGILMLGWSLRVTS